MARQHRHRHGAGFTLIEILIVIVIMAVMAAFVVPSFVSLNRGSVDEEARRLVQVLKMSADESILTGRIMRWSATEHAYYFETQDDKGQWHVLDAPPYQRYTLPDNIVIGAVNPPAAADEKSLRARYVMRGGVLSQPLELVLSTTDKEPLATTLRLEPAALSLKIRIVQGTK